ncbi:hypothetical protein [Streptosporangium roseum]|uniref:hypothetical protein n=1 Tax=Streptosporangium roseum TaxID=2001 RepID=UPI0004CD2A9E|nr:hypothetical protein [Streptosporangium roseum]
MAIDAPDLQQAPQPAPARRGLLGRAIGWVRTDHLRRGPLPLGAAAYGLAAGAHALDLPGWYGLPLTVLATIGGYARAMNMPGDSAAPGRVALATAAAGSWMTAAAEVGVAAGPYGLMAWLGGAAYWLAYWAYRRDPAISQAIAWEQAKADWHRRAAAYGLAGSHLLDWRETRLGEQMVIATRGTGKRASALVGPGLEEDIAEEEMLPKTRVKTRTGDIAGRITISIRYKNPWAEALPHPLLDPTPEIPLPPVADGREPYIIGMDPETGRPLQLLLWDEDGAKRVLVVAITRGGKTVVLSNVMERATAADNVFPIGINVSKAKEMRRWAPALGLSACGPEDRVKALRILELARMIIDWRASQDSDDATLIPGPHRPLVPVFVDEADELLAQSDPLGMAIRREFGYLMSKGGSEGVAAVVAGQRGTVGHLGNGNIKKMFDQAVLLKSAGASEVRHVLGDIGLTLPNMMTYGEGNPGVALVSDLAGHWDAGRSWKLKELTDIDRLARGRAACPLEPELVAFLGDKLTALTQLDAPAPRRTRRTSPPPAPVSETPMPADHSDPADRAAQQRADARARLNAIATPPPAAGLTAGQTRAAAIERRRQAAEQTDMSPEVRSLLLRLLAQVDGTTTREAEAAMQTGLGLEVGVSKTGAWRCLDKLRVEGLAEIRGKGRGRRWHLTAPTPAVDVAGPPVEDLDAGAADHERMVEVIEEEAAEAVAEELADADTDHDE